MAIYTTKKTKAARDESIEMDPAELWDHVEKTPAPGGVVSSEDAPSHWNGNITWAEAKHMARYGWPEGMERVAPVLARVDELVAHRVPGPVLSYDVQGDSPDVGAYLSGIPENMLTMETADGASKMVRIIANLGVSAAVSTKSIEARGIITCALVDALERVGYRCEVVACWRSHAGENPRKDGALYYGFKTVLKHAEEPLSLDRLTFAMIHPAFFRRVMFRAMELIPDVKDRNAFTQWGGYGRPAPVMGGPGDIVITEMYGGDEWTPETLATEVLKYLRQVGVHMDGQEVEA